MVKQLLRSSLQMTVFKTNPTLDGFNQVIQICLRDVTVVIINIQSQDVLLFSASVSLKLIFIPFHVKWQSICVHCEEGEGEGEGHISP